MSEFYNPPGNEPREPTLAQVGQQLLENDALQYTRFRERLLDQHVLRELPEADFPLIILPTSPYNFVFASAVALKSLGYQVTLSSPPDLLRKNITLSCAPDDYDTVNALLSFAHLPQDLFDESCFIESFCTGTRSASELEHGADNYWFKDRLKGMTQEEKDVSVKRAYLTGLVIWQDAQDNNAVLYGHEDRRDNHDTDADHQMYATIRQQGYTPYNIEQLYGMVEGNIVRRIAAMGDHAQPPANPPEHKVYR
jgi:hypothetical protein